MKQKLYIAGLVNLLVILTGTIFKINHYPGAGILISTGIICFVLLILPLTLINSYRNSESGSKILYLITGITGFVVFTSMLFKIMHWPYAGIALVISIFFLNVIFLPVFISVTGKDRNFNLYNIVFVLFLLALNSVFSALLSLNVSRVTITDSFSVPDKINSLKTSLLQMPDAGPKSLIITKIDDVLIVIDEYQATILSREGLTEEKWNNDPQSLYRPDSRDAVLKALIQKEDMQGGAKLRSAISELVEAASSTSGYDNLAKAIPQFAGLSDPGTGEDISHLFTEDFLTWALVYLDNLETNLRLLKSVYI
jgi:hypothetical protein